MGIFDSFRYDGKRVLVVGGTTGMGAAAAELAQEAGADVVIMDVVDITRDDIKFIHLNLSQQASIDMAIDECGGRVDAVFACAGVADGTPAIERINFVGHRYLIECMLAKGMLPRGSAICFISSSAGLGWEPNFVGLSELLETREFDEAARWMQDHGKANYMGTKQAVNAYVAREALRLIKRGVRINALCPGPTDTPLARAHAWCESGMDYRGEAGIEPSTPLEQAYPVVFLCSDAAAAITGVTLLSDVGWLSAGMTGSFPDAATLAGVLTNRTPAFQVQVSRE